MPTDLFSHTQDAILNCTRILQQWNALEASAAADEVLSCCGSKAWAQQIADSRPIDDAESLFHRSDLIWKHLSTADWDEAFSTHPRIGARKAPEIASAKSAQWSQQEQSGVGASSVDVQQRLAQGNDAYEHRFGRTYIVCAAGKSAAEMLEILEQRLKNEPGQELLEAAEQQRLIMRLRLRKWLQL